MNNYGYVDGERLIIKALEFSKIVWLEKHVILKN